MLTRKDLDADQINAIAFIASGEDSLLCADVGTGKTVIGYTAAIDALECGDVSRVLVLAPHLVATDTWANEPAEWDHIDGDAVAIACGNEKQRTLAVDSDAKIVIMNYENLSWLMAKYPRPRTIKGIKEPETLPFDMLICDEIDKLKSVSSKRFKDFRDRIGHFKKRVGMTGTLVPNELTEVWGQTYIIDGGQSFGRSFYEWRKTHFYPTDYKQYKWKPFPSTRQFLLDELATLAYRLEARGLPEVVMCKPTLLDLPAETRANYNELEDEFFLLIEDAKGKHREVDAANSAVLAGKLQQICAGFSYVDRTKEAVWHSRAKFEWLDALHGSLVGNYGEQLLIFYHYNEEADELRRRYPHMQFLGGGISNKKKLASIAAWNAGEIRDLALHPASAGHGLNLQKSGAHNIAFLTMPWSGGMFKQVCGRLARRGQVAEHINVHTAQFRNTIDEEVFGTVTGRLAGMQDFLDDLYIATAA